MCSFSQMVNGHLYFGGGALGIYCGVIPTVGLGLLQRKGAPKSVEGGH